MLWTVVAIVLLIVFVPIAFAVLVELWPLIWRGGAILIALIAALVFFSGQDSEPTRDIPDRRVAELAKGPPPPIQPANLMVVLGGVLVIGGLLFAADRYMEAPRRAQEKADREKERDENSREWLEEFEK